MTNKINPIDSTVSAMLAEMQVIYVVKHITLGNRSTKDKTAKPLLVDQYVVIFKHKDRGETFDYWSGVGHRTLHKDVRPLGYNQSAGIDWYSENTKPSLPSAAGVLYCLVGDAEAVNDTFENWADTFGYDSDSRQAEETYHACVESARKLHNIFTPAQIAALREALSEY